MRPGVGALTGNKARIAVAVVALATIGMGPAAALHIVMAVWCGACLGTEKAQP